MKDKLIHIRVDEEFKKQIEAKAKSIGLSLSAYITMILKRKLHQGHDD